MCARVCACAQMCVCAHVCVCLSVCVCACVSVREHACARLRAHVCLCGYVSKTCVLVYASARVRAIQLMCARVSDHQSPHHLISQDTVDAVVIQVNEPVHALHLVLPQSPACDDGGLDSEPVPSP